MHKRSCTAHSLVMVLALTTMAVAQQLPLSSEAFASADTAQKKAVLLQIIRHEVSTNGETVASVIKAGLVDPQPQLRATALAAVVSRAAGPSIVSNTASGTDWLVDREHIQ